MLELTSFSSVKKDQTETTESLRTDLFKVGKVMIFKPVHIFDLRSTGNFLALSLE